MTLERCLVGKRQWKPFGAQPERPFPHLSYTGKMSTLAQKNGMQSATVKVGLWVWLWQEWLRSGLLLFCYWRRAARFARRAQYRVRCRMLRRQWLQARQKHFGHRRRKRSRLWRLTLIAA